MGLYYDAWVPAIKVMQLDGMTNCVIVLHGPRPLGPQVRSNVCACSSGFLTSVAGSEWYIPEPATKFLEFRIQLWTRIQPILCVPVYWEYRYVHRIVMNKLTTKWIMNGVFSEYLILYPNPLFYSVSYQGSEDNWFPTLFLLLFFTEKRLRDIPVLAVLR